jgi:hypothetical protein
MAKRQLGMIGVQPVLEGLRTSAGAFRWLDDYCMSVLRFNTEYTTTSSGCPPDYPVPDVTRLSQIDPELDGALSRARAAAGPWRGPDDDVPRPPSVLMMRDEIVALVYDSVAETGEAIARDFGELSRVRDQIRSAGGKATKEQKAFVASRLLMLQGRLEHVTRSIARGEASLEGFVDRLTFDHDELAKHAAELPDLVDRYGDRLRQQMTYSPGKPFGTDPGFEQRVFKGYIQDLKGYWNEQLRLYVIPLNEGARSGISGLRTAWETVRGLLESSAEQISLASRDELGSVLQEVDLDVSANAWQEVARIAAGLRSELS